MMPELGVSAGSTRNDIQRNQTLLEAQRECGIDRGTIGTTD